jgi:hypothetical protein
MQQAFLFVAICYSRVFGCLGFDGFFVWRNNALSFISCTFSKKMKDQDGILETE